MHKRSLPKHVSKEDLKSHMLEFFREIERTGDELIVMDHHKPVLKVVPLERKSKSTESIFKPYRNKVVNHEDITTPTTEEWTEG